MLDVVFFSRLIPLDIKDDVLDKRKRTMSESGESLQWKIIEGLDANLDNPVKLLNYLPVQSYPEYYSEAFIKRHEFSHCEGSEDLCLPFINIKYIKRLVMWISLYKEIKKWAVSNTENEKVIISYSLIPEFTKAIYIAKKVNPGIKVCAVVADLPEYTILTKKVDWSSRLYLNWMKRKTSKHLNSVDCFALLTNQMADRLAAQQKYIVIEGIASSFPSDMGVKKRVSNAKRILYAGTLNERFGVMYLVSAFMQIKDSDYRLVICGIGDSEEKIKSLSRVDHRIIYMGQLKREQVLNEMLNSSVIVNPRLNGEEFTKYSFPSKNLEALSSGVPFVGYKLAGIPDEYDEFINYPADESIGSLAMKIIEVVEDVDGAFQKKATEAKRWVLQNKNATKQTARILGLITGK